MPYPMPSYQAPTEPADLNPELQHDIPAGPQPIPPLYPPNYPTFDQVQPTESTWPPRTTPLAETPALVEQPAAELTASPTPIFDWLDQTEQALVNQLSEVSTDETGLISKLKQVIEQTGLLESKEVTLTTKLKELQQLRKQAQTQPDQAHVIVTPDKQAEFDQLVTSTAAPTLEPEQPPVEVIPTPTVENAELHSLPTAPPVGATATPAMQHIVQALRATQPEEQQALLTDQALVYRSPDGVGVDIFNGDQKLHVSDAELLQAGLTFTDLAEIAYVSTDNT